jgi:transposase-like protein
MNNSTGVTQCPKCGSVSTYRITLQKGGQVLTCQRCHKNFTAQGQHGQFTGKNR